MASPCIFLNCLLWHLHFCLLFLQCKILIPSSEVLTIVGLEQFESWSNGLQVGWIIYTRPAWKLYNILDGWKAVRTNSMWPKRHQNKFCNMQQVVLELEECLMLGFKLKAYPTTSVRSVHIVIRSKNSLFLYYETTACVGLDLFQFFIFMLEWLWYLSTLLVDLGEEMNDG